MHVASFHTTLSVSDGLAKSEAIHSRVLSSTMDKSRNDSVCTKLDMSEESTIQLCRGKHVVFIQVVKKMSCAPTKILKK